jgi:hypothetical protein
MHQSIEILNPTNLVIPQYLGQMFLDPRGEVLYQARGTSPADWRLVTPGTLVGSFVKIYDFFLGPPEFDPQGVKAIERVSDANVIKDTLKMDGVEIHKEAFAWKTATGMQVAMVRLTFHKIFGYSFFFGFAHGAKAYAMPSGLGFTLEDGWLKFGEDHRWVYEGERLVLMVGAVKVDGGYTGCGSVNGKDWGLVPALAVGSPVLALFVRRGVDRKVAPGYELALKRTLNGNAEQQTKIA